MPGEAGLPNLEGMMQVSVTKEFTFDAAHCLPGYDGACARLHGHTYRLQVTVTRSRCSGAVRSDPEADGMVIDFKDLSALVKEHVLEVFDHSYLNDLVAFRPTAERLAMHILLILRRVSPLEILVKEVKLWETPTSFATATWC